MQWQRVSLLSAAALLSLSTACASNSQADAKPAEVPAAPASQPAVAAAETGTSAMPDKGTKPSTRDQVDADGVVRRGAPLSDGPLLAVADAFKQADTLNGQTVKLTGTVKSVCAKKGCWFAITADGMDTSVRITAKDYGHFMPKNAAGKTAIVEGVLNVKVQDVKTLQHYEDDRAHATGQPAKKITEAKREVSVVASAVELR